MENELKHYGVLGMKWGIRRTAAQLGHKVKAYKRKKKQQHSLEKARQARIAKKKYDEDKQKALKEGNATDILKYKGDLTNDEMRKALDRIDLERRLKDISAKETKAGSDKVESVMNKVQKANDAANKAMTAYNTVAKIHNSLSDNKLPVLDGVSPSEKKKAEAEKKRKEEREKFIETATPEEAAKKFGELSVKDLEDLTKRYNYEKLIREKISQ